MPTRPHIIIRKKQRKYAVAMIRVVEEERRAVRVMERNAEVVFRIRICSLDLLFLLYQDKRKEATLRNAVKQIVLEIFNKKHSR